MSFRFASQSLLASIGVTVLFLFSGCTQATEVPDEVPLVPVTGQVTLGEEPLGDADVVFYPVETTAGIGGATRTDATGKFAEVRYHRGGVGLPVGKYRVSVSKRVNPDGSPVPPNDTTPPIESNAKELLPAAYSSTEQSKIEVVVEDGKPVEIKLEKTK